MTEITLKLRDELIKEYGEVYIKDFFEKQIENLSFMRTMSRIEERIKESGMDHDKELENVRQKAWDEYKKDFFN